MNKKSLKPATEIRRERNMKVWNDFEGTLKDQDVEISFKINEHYFPETMRSTSSPYLCEINANQLNFIRFNPQSIEWKKQQEVMLQIPAESITCIKMTTRKDLDFIFGPFPTETDYLEVELVLENNESYHLFSKIRWISKEIAEWCQKNAIDFIDQEQLVES